MTVSRMWTCDICQIENLWVAPDIIFALMNVMVFRELGVPYFTIGSGLALVEKKASPNNSSDPESSKP